MVQTKTVEHSNHDKWYSRPILAVADMPRSLQHYCELLGFTQAWQHDEGGRTIVTQVDKGECELILAENLDQVGASRVYVALEAAEMQQLEQRVRDKNIPVEHVFWGYDLLRICDPDGNQILVSADC